VLQVPSKDAVWYSGDPETKHYVLVAKAMDFHLLPALEAVSPRWGEGCEGESAQAGSSFLDFAAIVDISWLSSVFIATVCEFVSFCVQISPSYRDTNGVGSRPTLMAST
jgi:hypothetical protein